MIDKKNRFLLQIIETQIDFDIIIENDNLKKEGTHPKIKLPIGLINSNLMLEFNSILTF